MDPSVRPSVKKAHEVHQRQQVPLLCLRILWRLIFVQFPWQTNELGRESSGVGYAQGEQGYEMAHGTAVDSSRGIGVQPLEETKRGRSGLSSIPGVARSG